MLWVSDLVLYFHFKLFVRNLINLSSRSDVVVDCLSHPRSCEDFTKSRQSWNGRSTLYSNYWTCCGACLLGLVFFNSFVPIFPQAMALESSLVVWAPSTSSGYVIIMGAGCCFWIMGGTPEHLFSMQREYIYDLQSTNYMTALHKAGQARPLPLRGLVQSRVICNPTNSWDGQDI